MARIIRYIFLFFFLFSSVACPATYYADTGGSGTDCTIGTPCTLEYAVETKASSGDTVSVNDGSYGIGASNSLSIPAGVNVTATNQTDPPSARIYPTANKAYGDYMVTMSTATPDSAGSQELSYIELDGADSGYVAYSALLVRNRNDVHVDYNYIHDFSVNISNPFTVQIESSQIARTDHWWDYVPTTMGEIGDDSTWTNWPSNPVERFEFDHNTITSCGAISPFNVKDSNFHDNIIDNSSSFSRGYKATVSLLQDVNIYNETITTTGAANYYRWSIELWGHRNCTYHDNILGADLSLTIGKKVTIYNNTIVHPTYSTDTYQSAIECSTISFLEVYNNYMEKVGSGIRPCVDQNSTSNSYTIKNNSIHNNIVNGFKTVGIWIPAFGNPSFTTPTYSNYNFYIFNNVLDGNSNGLYGIAVSQQDQAAHSVIANVNVFNNIITRVPNYAGYKAGTVSSLTINTNGYYNNTYDSWSGGVFDPNSITANPHFLSPGNGYDGYALTSNSVDYIDAGRYFTLVNDGDDCVADSEDCSTIVVDDAGFLFVDNYVYVAAAVPFVEKITAINYITNTLTLDTEHSYENNTEVYRAVNATSGFSGLGIDIGAIEYGSFLHTPYPTNLQDCPDDGIFGCASTENATVRFSVKGTDTCATDYADLDTEMSTTGTTSHEHDVGTPDCDTTVIYVVKGLVDGIETNCLEIIIDVAAGEGETPQPAPGMIIGDGNITIVGDGNLLIH